MLEDTLREHFAWMADTLVRPGADQRLREFVAALAREDRQGQAPAGRSRGAGRARRVLAPVAAATAVVVLAAGTAFAAGRGTAGHASRPQRAAAPTPKPAPTALITPQFVVRTTTDLLPAQGRESRMSGFTAPGLVGGVLGYVSGSRSAGLVVEVGYPPRQTPARHTAACAVSSTLPSTAQHTPLNDGSTLVVVASTPYRALQVSLCRPDGVSVTAVEKAATTPGPPPLDAAELAAIVTSSRWQVRVPADQVAAAAGLFRTGGGARPTIAPTK